MESPRTKGRTRSSSRDRRTFASRERPTPEGPMPTKRRPLQLLPHEDELLRTLYREYNVPTDQYPQRPDDLIRLVSTWNGFTGRNESAPDVLHYMVNKRKNGQWER